MDLEAIIYTLIGSTLGLILRFFIQDNFRKDIGFSFTNISVVNILASFILGILVALNPINTNLFFLVYIGFLGCFSTFSSFIYQLFTLLSSRQFVRFFLHFLEEFSLSFIFFYTGYYLVNILK